MKMIEFDRTCRHFRMTDIDGCPYAVCLSHDNHEVGPDLVACQFSMSCGYYQKPSRNGLSRRTPTTGFGDARIEPQGPQGKPLVDPRVPGRNWR
jgi:hypothetical protein